MVYTHARRAVAAILLLGALYLPATASGRRRTETRPAKPAVSFVPSSGAPEALDAPILSGLDFTAIAPPGERLRVVEDEPYILLQGYNKKGLLQLSQGMSKLTIHSNSLDGGRYEAKISLRYDPQKNDRNRLLLSFDTAAHYAYNSSLLFGESRGTTAYNLREIRSPLGLTDPRDKENLWREYLAYDAAVINPNSPVASGTATPYQYISGELKVVRRVEARYYLLSINFEAEQYAQALTLTENIARCIINRMQPEQDPAYRLAYAAYYPEFELARPYYEGEQIDPRTADLAERPGEGCGIGAAPISGDVCPECGEGGPFWPAAPFGDTEYGSQLGTPDILPQCSHCLLIPPASVEKKSEGCEEKVCEPPCPSCGHNHALHTATPPAQPPAHQQSETVAQSIVSEIPALDVGITVVANPAAGPTVAEVEAKATAKAVRDNAQNLKNR